MKWLIALSAVLLGACTTGDHLVTQTGIDRQRLLSGEGLFGRWVGPVSTEGVLR